MAGCGAGRLCTLRLVEVTGRAGRLLLLLGAVVVVRFLCLRLGLCVVVVVTEVLRAACVLVLGSSSAGWESVVRTSAPGPPSHSAAPLISFPVISCLLSGSVGQVPKPLSRINKIIFAN